MHTKFWSENLKLRDYSVDVRRWEDNIRMDLREIGWELWTKFIWLRRRSSDGLL